MSDDDTTTTTVTRTVDAPPDALWRTVAAGGDVHVWFPDIIASSELDGEGAGAVRRCTMADGATLIERLLEIDHDARTFVYAIDEHPLPASDVVATITVEALDGERSRVHWGARFTASGAERERVEAMLRQIYARGIANLAAHHDATVSPDN